MALTAVNPKVLSTPSPIGLARVARLASDSKTWKKGELCYLTSGTVAPLTTTTGSSLVYGIFAADQTTSTSTSTVWVYVLEVGTELEMFITNNGSATGASENDVTIGTVYEAYQASNVCYLDVAATTTPQFKVLDYYTNLNEEAAEFYSHTADSEPGIVKVKFILASAT